MSRRPSAHSHPRQFSQFSDDSAKSSMKTIGPSVGDAVGEAVGGIAVGVTGGVALGAGVREGDGRGVLALDVCATMVSASSSGSSSAPEQPKAMKAGRSVAKRRQSSSPPAPRVGQAWVT
jgi:hypothetical protein